MVTFLSRIRRRHIAVFLVVLLAGGAFSAYSLGVPLPGAAPSQPVSAENDQQRLKKVELAKGHSHVLTVPAEVRSSLGIRKNGHDLVAVAEPPKGKRPIVLSATTRFEPSSLYRTRARFAPAEVVKIGTFSTVTASGTQDRELQTGDFVKENTPLGIFYSVDVGSKKNDLIDALVQYRLDKDIADRAQLSGVISEVQKLTYDRNLQADVNAINRSLKTLETWKIPADEIEAVYAEADDIVKSRSRREFNAKKYDPNKEDKWGRVVLRAPVDGYIVERNVSEKEIVVDSNMALFQIGRIDRLQVVANATEETVKELYEQWKKSGLKWTIHTLGDPEGEGYAGTVDEISMLVDPNQHSVPIKGMIDNSNRVLRAGQYVTATIELPPPGDVVEIPANAVADDGKQAIVFVQLDPDKAELAMRRVMVTQRIDNRVFVRSKLSDKEKELTPEEQDQGLLPREPLQLGERVIMSGLLELKKELEDLESEKSE